MTDGESGMLCSSQEGSRTRGGEDTVALSPDPERIICNGKSRGRKKIQRVYDDSSSGCVRYDPVGRSEGEAVSRMCAHP